MVQQKLIVRNAIGIHSRPAALIVEAAKKSRSAITVARGEHSASAQSMVRLLTLKVRQNDEILVSAEGEDEVEALAAIASLVESKFGEE